MLSAVDHKPKTTTRLQRIVNIEADPRVSVLADGYAEDWDLLWWVRGDGVARVIDDDQDCDAAVAALTTKYQQYRARRPIGPAIAIEVTRWVGWAAHSGDAE